MLRVLFAVALFAALWSAQSAGASLKYPLHYGNRGTPVCNGQYLLSQKGAPGVYRQPWFQIYKRRIRKGRRCLFDSRTVRATKGMKYRLGFCGPRRPCKIDGHFTRYLRDILTGKVKRPSYMQRTAFLRRHPPKRCIVADRVVHIARQEVGQHEVPWGSNWGPRVSTYLRTTGLRYPAYWCAAFAQSILKWAGIGPVAHSSAGVGYISGYARQHGWLRSDVKRGYLVAWGSQHIGIIDTVVRSHGAVTGFYTVEGNSSDAVTRRFYRYRYLLGTLIKVPGLDRRIQCGR